MATAPIPSPGQKIFITWGDHDMTDNIIQLVLARLPDAPAGSKGISLFVAPKFLVNADGSLGERNAVRCIGLEHKMGIHASPTCVMEYDGAKGWLVGEAEQGPRRHVHDDELGAAQCRPRRRRGRPRPRCRRRSPMRRSASRARRPASKALPPSSTIPTSSARSPRWPPACRPRAAICYACGAAADLAEHAADPAVRHAAKLREDLLTPLAKAWSTDRAVDVTNTGVQIHGGMGFMGETAAAQFYLDARITPIYEGTNGIQAIDLVGRKLAMNNGAAMAALHRRRPRHCARGAGDQRPEICQPSRTGSKAPPARSRRQRNGCSPR